MANYEKYLTEMGHSGDLVAMADEILKLRQMLWQSHGHTGQYGDDGELQCAQCAQEYGFWDWKRTPIDEIQSKITEANMKKVAENTTLSSGGAKCSAEVHALKRIGGYAICPDCYEDLYLGSNNPADSGSIMDIIEVRGVNGADAGFEVNDYPVLISEPLSSDPALVARADDDYIAVYVEICPLIRWVKKHRPDLLNI